MLAEGRGGEVWGGARRFIVLGAVLGGEVVDTIEGPGGGWSPREVEGYCFKRVDRMEPCSAS